MKIKTYEFCEVCGKNTHHLNGICRVCGAQNSNHELIIENLINWGELSRLLAGNRSSITRKRIPAIHQEKINKLINLLEDWYRNDAKSSKIAKPEKDDA